MIVAEDIEHYVHRSRSSLTQVQNLSSDVHVSIYVR